MVLLGSASAATLLCLILSGRRVKPLPAAALLILGPVQVTAHYVAMTPNGRVFDSSLDRGFPYDIRIGSGQARPHLGPSLVTESVVLPLVYVPLSLREVQHTPDHMNIIIGCADCGRAR